MCGMSEFLFLMHDDATSDGDWGAYLAKLQATGCFLGGSAIGGGVTTRKSGLAGGVSKHLTGYFKLEADDLAHAQTFLAGNPVFENGGTVEIRELPKS